MSGTEQVFLSMRTIHKTRGSLSLYSWYAWDRGQIPNMAVTGPNFNRDMKKKEKRKKKKKSNPNVDSWYHE